MQKFLLQLKLIAFTFAVSTALIQPQANNNSNANSQKVAPSGYGWTNVMHWKNQAQEAIGKHGAYTATLNGVKSIHNRTAPIVVVKPTAIDVYENVLKPTAKHVHKNAPIWANTAFEKTKDKVNEYGQVIDEYTKNKKYVTKTEHLNIKAVPESSETAHKDPEATETIGIQNKKLSEDKEIDHTFEKP
uniref:Uncharacterized protein n=1 Tax=Ditylenchus dipsaci TaxID=166011 RepID=A0A915ECV0_9BILA